MNIDDRVMLEQTNGNVLKGRLHAVHMLANEVFVEVHWDPETDTDIERARRAEYGPTLLPKDVYLPLRAIRKCLK